MIMLGLLVAALICIIVGIVTASGPWFIASLVASAAAGFRLWQQRNKLGQPHAEPGARSPRVAGPHAWVVDGRPEYHREHCADLPAGAERVPLHEAVDDGFVPCARCLPAGEAGAPADQVWVVDGRPRYHLTGCATISGLTAEQIPLAQAKQDGFIPCSLCAPTPL